MSDYDYSKIGLNQYMQPLNSPIGQHIPYLSALEQDNLFEYSPFAQPNLISKGTLNTTLGGALTLYDATGGTKIFTYNPSTGVVTILGSLIANNVNTGTYTNVILAGTPSLVGTLSGGLVGPTQLSGTFNNGVLGTPTITGASITGTTSSLTGTLTGTPSMVINSGSAALSVNGNMELQSYGTSVILAIRSGGTTFRFAPIGTI